MRLLILRKIVPFNIAQNKTLIIDYQNNVVNFLFDMHN